MLNTYELAHIYLTGSDDLDQLDTYQRGDFQNWVELNYTRMFTTSGLVAGFAQVGPNGYDELVEHTNRTGEILVSTSFNNSPLLPGVLNLYFRAWHDAIHYNLDCDFSLKGEAQVAWISCQQTENRTYQKILFSEIVLQAAVYFATGDFAPGAQKLVLVSDELLDEFLAGGLLQEWAAAPAQVEEPLPFAPDWSNFANYNELVEYVA